MQNLKVGKFWKTVFNSRNFINEKLAASEAIFGLLLAGCSAWYGIYGGPKLLARPNQTQEIIL